MTESPTAPASAEPLTRSLATAILGIDALWGGDVANPSGTGRFIADCWFSDEPLPPAYTLPEAARLREIGGVSAKEPGTAAAAIDAYLARVDVRGAIAEVVAAAKSLPGARGSYLAGLGTAFEVMWDLALEVAGRGEPVPHARCVRAMTGRDPEPSDPAARLLRVRELLAAAGHAPGGPGGLLGAVDAWRGERTVPAREIPARAGEVIADLDARTVRHLLPHLPASFAAVPRANVAFLPIENAWFSGSMNYLGRARTADGRPLYEATYEINAALQISFPEFVQLVSHEVVPGHVTTSAFLQDLWVRGEAGFEATVLTMNTPAATLAEGIANNAILVAYGVLEPHELPDRDLELGVLLALLQDDAKNHSSYLTWTAGESRGEVARLLRNDFLVSEERADKLSGAWGRHPLMGRMYLPAYRHGTELVARLRREHPAGRVLPAMYGAFGPSDALNLEGLVAGS